MADLQAALEGDYDAYMRLKIAASEKIFAKLDVDDTELTTELENIQA